MIAQNAQKTINEIYKQYENLLDNLYLANDALFISEYSELQKKIVTLQKSNINLNLIIKKMKPLEEFLPQNHAASRQKQIISNHQWKLIGSIGCGLLATYLSGGTMNLITPIVSTAGLMGGMYVDLKKHQSLIQCLHQWVNSAPKGINGTYIRFKDNYLEATKRIIDFVIDANANELNLSSLTLWTIPPIFQEPCFKNKLKTLKLNNNILTKLSDFSELDNLNLLDLHGNLLSSFHAQNLNKLQILDLSCNKIASFSLSAKSLGELKNLTLYENALNSFNVQEKSLQNLSYLDLSKNNITSWNTSLKYLQSLQYFNISDNLSITIPPSLGRRTNLDIVKDDSIQGNSLKDELEPLYELIGKPFPKFYWLQTINNVLIEWLNRMQLKNLEDPAELQELVKKIIGYMELAEKDPNFLLFLKNNLIEATTTCGDRIILSVITIGLAYQIQTKSFNSLSETLDFFKKAVVAIQALEKIARRKVDLLKSDNTGFSEDLEVYLAYMMQMKDKFALPLDVDHMLFMNLSGLKKKDFQEAEKELQILLKDNTACYQILITFDSWISQLKEKYPKKVLAIETQRDHAIRVGDPANCQKIYESSLVKLIEQEILDEQIARSFADSTNIEQIMQSDGLASNSEGTHPYLINMIQKIITYKKLDLLDEIFKPEFLPQLKAIVKTDQALRLMLFQVLEASLTVGTPNQTTYQVLDKLCQFDCMQETLAIALYLYNKESVSIQEIRISDHIHNAARQNNALTTSLTDKLQAFQTTWKDHEVQPELRKSIRKNVYTPLVVVQKWFV